MYRRPAFLKILAAVFVMFLAIPAANATKVLWGGFAFQGDFDAGKIRYPLSLSLSEQQEGNISILDRRLIDSLQNLKNDSFNLVFDELGSLGPGSTSSIVLAFVLDRETVSIESFGSEHKLLIELSAQALFFDYNEMAVIASYPITLRYNDVKQSMPTDDDAAAVVEGLYVGDLDVNIFEQFFDLLSTVSLNTSVSRRIQITAVSVEQAVEEHLANWKQNLQDFESSVAQEFSRSLSKNQHIPVLPYAAGYAIGNRMATRFANGEVFDLTIPEPDYEISLVIPKLAIIEYAKVPAGTSYVYGAFLHIKAEEPVSRRIYIDATIKNGEIKTVSALQTSVDDWAAYQATMLLLIEKFTTVLSDPTKQWVEKHVGDKAVLKQIHSFAKVVQSCR